MTLILELIVLVAGLAVGLQLPDVDHVFFFLTHRSALTHGVILPCLALLLVRDRGRLLQLAVAGLALGIAVHLSFDLFPRRWVGFAQIHAPLVGYLDGALSVLWIAGNMVACCYLALVAVPARRLLGLALVVAGWGLLISAQREAGWLTPLLSLGAALFVATCLPNRLIDGGATARQWARVVRATVRRP